MSEVPHPPAWADRFLGWYCNPELLEEIQGDAHELYFDRLERKGKRLADILYVWDVIRFCRPSNVRRSTGQSADFRLIWNINLKLALRNAMRNKLIFSVKIAALATCIAFALLLSAVVINDTTYDHHYVYQNLYRVGCHVIMNDKESNYAVSPLPLGPALAEEVPGIDGYTRFIIIPHPYFKFKNEQFYNIPSYAADSNFLKLFPQQYLEGTSAALDEPNKIVLTRDIAIRLFGDQLALGKTIDLGWTQVDVGAVIEDQPMNTHFTFEALVSWSTFQREDEWTNFNAYTYVRVRPGTNMAAVDSTISQVANDYLAPMMDNYKFNFKPIVQRVDAIHLSGFMDEDFAVKRNRSYIYILISVIVLFLLTGLFNYLNLALAELTLQMKKIAVLRAFGGAQADTRGIASTEALFCLVIVAPIVAIIVIATALQPGLFSAIDPHIWKHPLFVSIVAGIILLILISSRANGFIAAGRRAVASALKGSASSTPEGLGLRKILVASQLAFSMIMIGLIVVILDQFRFLNEMDKGFEASNVLVIKRNGKSSENATFEQAVRGIAGIGQVAGSSFYPEGAVETKDIIEMETSTGTQNVLINYMFSEKDYPALLGMRLKAGRLFYEDGGNNENTFLINEAAARMLGWKDPIGKRISFPVDSKAGSIVGVVKDFHFESMHSAIAPLVIVFTNGSWGINYVYIKSSPLATSAVASVEAKYKSIFPDAPMDWSYLDARYQSLYKDDFEIKDIFRSGLAISIFVSMLGIFSISALILNLRTKEMGIRKVVGAGSAHLFMLHLRPFAAFFGIAVVIGIPLMIYISNQWLNNFAYHVEIRSIYFIVPLLATAGLIVTASGYHAIMCTKVNPVDVLKAE